MKVPNKLERQTAQGQKNLPVKNTLAYWVHSLVTKKMKYGYFSCIMKHFEFKINRKLRKIDIFRYTLMSFYCQSLSLAQTNTLANSTIIKCVDHIN